MARKRKTQTEATDALLLGDAAPVVGDAVASASAIPAARAWRVVRETKVSLFGHMTTLPEGCVVTAAEYGPDGIERIAAQAELVSV